MFIAIDRSRKTGIDRYSIPAGPTGYHETHNTIKEAINHIAYLNAQNPDGRSSYAIYTLDSVDDWKLLGQETQEIIDRASENEASISKLLHPSKDRSPISRSVYEDLLKQHQAATARIRELEILIASYKLTFEAHAEMATQIRKLIN